MHTNEEPQGKKYKIGMASKHAGVSPQTVRYYEKQDLFSSLKEDFSTTRYYSVRHFKWLSNIRRYFKCGFSEQEVRELVNCDTLEEMTQLIDQRIDISQRELKELRGRIASMERMRTNIQRIPSLLNRVVLEECPAFSVLITRAGDDMLHDAATEQMLTRWLEQIQITSLASVIPQKILCESPDSTYRLSGHCVQTAFLPMLGCSADDPVLRKIQPQPCLHTICALTGDKMAPAKLLPHVYQYLQDFGLKICGDAFGQSLAVLKESDNAETSQPKATYYEYWIPVREI